MRTRKAINFTTDACRQSAEHWVGLLDFAAEFTNYSITELDRLTVDKFFLVLARAEAIYDARVKAIDG